MDPSLSNAVWLAARAMIPGSKHCVSAMTTSDHITVHSNARNAVVFTAK